MARNQIIFALLGISLSASAQVIFKDGFRVGDTALLKSTEQIDTWNILVCDPRCRFTDEDKPVEIPFSGFGKYKDLLQLSEKPAAPEMKAPNSPPPETPAPPPETALPAPPKSSPTLTQLPTGIENFKAPYPKPGTVFLIKRATQIYIFPKEFCTAACKMTLIIKDKLPQEISYQAGERPLTSTKVDGEGEARITLVEGDASGEINFTWKAYTPQNLKESIIANHNVEIPR